MLTDEQKVRYLNSHYPPIEMAFVTKGVPQDLATALAVKMVLDYIEEAHQAPGLDIPIHSYGVKVRLVGDVDIYVWVTFSTPTLEAFT